MRLIHTSNLNLEATPSTGIDNLKAKERKQELILNFERLVDFAKRNLVDAIIITGDLFSTDTISPKTKEMVITTILNNPKIDFVYVSGKFDGAFIRGLDIIPANLKLFDNDFYTLKYEDVDITGVNNSNTYNYTSLALNEKKINIVCMYGDVETEINPEKLKSKGIDYLALGGYKTFTQKTLDDRGIYSYSGELEAASFTDFGVKGFVLLEVKNGRLDYEFMPFARRTAEEVIFDLTGIDGEAEFKKVLERKLDGISSDDIVSMKLTGGYFLNINKEKKDLEEVLNNRFYYATVTDESYMYVNPKDYSNDVSLKGEFIKNVMKSNLSEDDKKKVIEYGIKALLKEEF